MNKPPSKEEIMTYNVVPVKIAAEYLGMSQQTVRNGMRKGYLNIGEVVGSGFYIYPDRLIACRTGEAPAQTSKETVIYFLQELIAAVKGGTP